MRKSFLSLNFLGLLCLLMTACNEKKTTPPDPLAAEHGQVTGIPAIDALTRDIAANPKNKALRIARANAYSEEGMYKEAQEEARRIYEYDKTDWRAATLLAWAYFDNQQSKPALKTLERALELYPDTIPLLLAQSEINLHVQQYNEALTSTEMVLKMEPLNTNGHFMRGMTLKYMGDTLSALESFQTVVEQDADHIKAYLQLAGIFASKREKMAIDYFDNILRIDSTQYTALKGKADFYHQNFNATNGMLEKAKAAYEKAIIHHPQEADGTANYALLHMELGEYQQAEHFFDVAIQYDPTFGTAYYYKGEALERQGKYDAAKIAYQNAINTPDARAPRERSEAALARLVKGDYLKAEEN